MNLQILIGTTSGNTEYLADHVAQEINCAGHHTSLHDQPDLNTLISQQNTYAQEEDPHWLICVATHGAGEYAESMLGFIEELTNTKPDLSNLKAAIIAVGDSSYDTFCQAGEDCEVLLLELGATLIYPTLKIDMLNDLDPELSATAWLHQWLDKLKTASE